MLDLLTISGDARRRWPPGGTPPGHRGRRGESVARGPALALHGRLLLLLVHDLLLLLHVLLLSLSGRHPVVSVGGGGGSGCGSSCGGLVHLHPAGRLGVEEVRAQALVDVQTELLVRRHLGGGGVLVGGGGGGRGSGGGGGDLLLLRLEQLEVALDAGEVGGGGGGRGRDLGDLLGGGGGGGGEAVRHWDRGGGGGRL